VTLVSWALTASAKGVVDPSKSSFSFAYTKRAFPLSETSSTIPFFRTDRGRIGNVRDCVRGSGDTLFESRILEIFCSTCPLAGTSSRCSGHELIMSRVISILRSPRLPRRQDRMLTNRAYRLKVVRLSGRSNGRLRASGLSAPRKNPCPFARVSRD